MTNSLPSPSTPVQRRLFGGFSENDFSLSILRGIALAENNHLILDLIRADQIRNAIEKKQSRKKDQEWQNQNGATPLLGNSLDENWLNNITLAPNRGCPRMEPMIVFIFLLVRGFLGNIKGSRNVAFIKESKFLECILHNYGVEKLPGMSTILDQLNGLSEATLRSIHELTIKEALVLSKDDFTKLYFDSTRVSADSAWPTESRTIADLLSRIRSGFEIFRSYGIKVNLPAKIDELIAHIHRRNKQIALNSGKRGFKKQLKKLYSKILRDLRTLLKTFRSALDRAVVKIGDILPSLREGLEGLAESIDADIHNAELCGENARSRVLKGNQVGPEQKILGISDPDAEMIPKGLRSVVFGYKPQVGRSKGGFIVSVLVPQGNAADSDQLKPITDEAIHNTGVLPDVISYDDGYTNKKIREKYLEQGIKVVSFSGAKGKAQIEEWDQPEYEEARNQRSMAESTMSILKGSFDLDRFSRRGREAVTQELLTAVIFHNIKLLNK